MIPFVIWITVLQRQDWLRGKFLYKREKKTQNRGDQRGKNRENNTATGGGGEKWNLETRWRARAKKNRAEIQSKKGTNSQREGEKGKEQHKEESALLLSSSLQKKKNPKSVKKKTLRKPAYPLPSSLVHLKNWEEDKTVDTAGRRQRTRTEEESRGEQRVSKKT
jgi:hypothetical protein